MTRKLASILFCLVGINLAWAGQGTVALKVHKVEWSLPISIETGHGSQKRLTFQSAVHTPNFGFNPILMIDLGARPAGQFLLRNCVYQQLTVSELATIDTTFIEQVIQTKVLTGTASFETRHQVVLHPFRKYQGKYQKLTSYSYQWLVDNNKQEGNSVTTKNSRQSWAASSVLATGRWHKLAVTGSGLYKLDYNYFQNVLGINPTQIDPRNIRIHSHGGAMLPTQNAVLRSGDIPELPIWFNGESDGRFDGGDYLLFYAQGPHEYTYNTQNRTIGHRLNLYSDSAYFYLTIGSNPGQRIQELPATTPGLQVINSFDHLDWHETEQFNLLKSGREWYGENFDFILSRNFSFNGDGILPNSEAKIRIATLATGLRCNPTAHRSSFSFTLNGSNLGTINHSHNCPYSLAVLGYNQQNSYTPIVGPGPLNFSLTYNKNGFNEAVGYLNWIEVQTKRESRLYGNAVEMVSFESLDQPISTFSLSGISQGLQVWDITNTASPVALAVNYTSQNATFDFESTTLRRFVAFTGSGFAQPIHLGQQANQDLHALSTPDLIIITPSVFSDQAQRLAAIRSQSDRLDVQVVTTAQIYAEYSSGRQDLVGIRDFLRSLYFKNPGKLKYVLLFGDCSFDYKNRLRDNTNFVPVFESINSLNPINSYNSDDFIGFMDDSEGEWREWQGDLIDVGIGRLVVKNPSEAGQMVDKLISYQNTPANLGPWRTLMTMAADNGDGMLHLSDAEVVTSPFETQFPDFNVNKIYVTAFPTVSSPLGSVSPAARAALNEAVNEGSLMVNYAGHGNEFQWTSEQILTMDGIRRDWRNPNNLPFFVTATCDFGRYDDPTLVSGGEFISIMPNGGGIGLVTTTRPVYANNNLRLNREFTNAVFTKTQGRNIRLGDALKICKNRSVVFVPTGSDDPGNRSFSLLGDPSMRLAFPEYPIMITALVGSNGQALDSIRALDRVVLRGQVNDFDGQLKNTFNGIVYCTIYDKANLFNVSEGPIRTSFALRNSIIYSGTATVVNGQFSISFVSPLDINYLMGRGKISIYAKDEDQRIDAVGSKTDLIIGGSNEFPDPDNDPPLVNNWMDDTTFSSGGITGPDPLFLAKVQDENGVNLATSGIGHDMLLVIDGDVNKTYSVNRYYTADPNTYKSGWVKYPLYDLAPGRHTATLTVWDTYNNSSRQTIDFVVRGSRDQLSVNDVKFFPNPGVAGNQVALSLQQTLTGQSLTVKLDLFDMLGRKVNATTWSIESAANNLGANRDLVLDLRTAQGDLLASGQYIGRVTVVAADGQQVSGTARLIVR